MHTTFAPIHYITLTPKAMFSVLPFLLFFSHISAESPAAYTPSDYFLLNCGASSRQQSGGRTWDTDSFSKFIPADAAAISSTSTAAEQGSSVNQVPYTTGVRFFKSPFTYSFPVSAGPKFIRLYFFPAQYSEAAFNKSESFFSVTANEHTLLANFSAYLNAAVDPTVNREYIVNVDEKQMLNLTFTPKPDSYAFVNGIEIVSIPIGYYIRGDAPDLDYSQIKWVGSGSSGDNYELYNNTALETLYRLNVGGKFVSENDDSGMYRIWQADDHYVIGYGYFTPQLDVKVIYTSSTPPYSAPQIVYTTSRTIGNYSSVVNWTFPVDSGFLYLFRLYFCEFAIEIDGANERVFSVDIANLTAEKHVDVFLLAGGSKIPIYRDYLVKVPDDRRRKVNVSFAIRPNMETRPVWANALLNGLEIFKLNDTNGSLAASNPDREIQSPPPGNKKGGGGATVGVIVGCVIGGILVIALLGLFLIFRKRKRVGSSTASVTKASNWAPLSAAVSASTRNTDGSGSSLPSDLCRYFSLEDLKSATSNFNDNFVIGKGGFGKVYRGYVDNGAVAVAIKRLNPESSQGIREFQTEIEMLSRLRHLHLVSLIGYCNDNGEMLLVYDYMARGTLRDHLYKTDNPSLPWKKRLEICIGAAKGLHYLHTGAKWTVIHRDVKSTNILLDERWVAKVSDFGLSKVGPLGEAETHVSTAVKGSIGYVDPEYYRRQQVTEKSDVYSFGVVLFEVLCARPAVIPTQTRERVNLAEWARQCCKKGTVDEMVDPRLRGEIVAESLKKYAEIACNCLKDEGIERPGMSDVVWSLEFALQLQETAEKVFSEGGEGLTPLGSPSFPLLGNVGDSNSSEISEGVNFSTSNGTTTGTATTTTTTSIEGLQSHNVFSLLNHPEGR